MIEHLKRIAFRWATFSWWLLLALALGSNPTYRTIGMWVCLSYIGLYLAWALPIGIIESRRLMRKYRAERGELVTDPHPFPHMMTDTGGCCCQCAACVEVREDGFRRCVCPRCSQDCPGIGRLGLIGPNERLVTVGTAAPRVYRRNTTYRGSDSVVP